jgi:hypothetical protein
MGAYRFVVFPPRTQPTAGEVDELREHAGLLGHRFTFGRDRKGGGLAIAFDGNLFEQAVRNHLSFDALVCHWKVRGARVEDDTDFVKDPSALHPIRTAAPTGAAASTRNPVLSGDLDTKLSAKQLASLEALGRSGLEVHQTLQRHATIGRIAAWMPYLLMGGAAAALLATGLYTANRLLAPGVERRRETIQRVADDAMQQGLTRHAALPVDSLDADQAPGPAPPPADDNTVAAEESQPSNPEKPLNDRTGSGTPPPPHLELTSDPRQ